MGTLVIHPPSLYTGGELIVYDERSQTNEMIDFGQNNENSRFSVYFAAQYARQEYEVLEVKNGYRLEFVYSLCCDKG